MKTPMQQPNDKRFVVMYEDGSYYGSFSPLGVWETYEGAANAENNWKEANPSKKTSIEEVDYHEKLNDQ